MPHNDSSASLLATVPVWLQEQLWSIVFAIVFAAVGALVEVGGYISILAHNK